MILAALEMKQEVCKLETGMPGLGQHSGTMSGNEKTIWTCRSVVQPLHGIYEALCPNLGATKY